MPTLFQRILTIFLLYIVSVTAVLAQGYIIIGGKVIDKATQQPIPFAHIGVMTRGTGTIANENGEFYYRFPRIAAEEGVVVSVMGYKNYTRKGADFTPNDRSVVIELEAAKPVVVDEAYVKSFNARGLVSGALTKVPSNYSDAPVMMNGFYQETLQQDDDYVDIREAVLKVEKDPRPKIEIPEKVRLMRGRRYRSTGRSGLLEEYEFPNGTAIVTKSIDTGLPEYLAGSNLSDYSFQLDDTITFYNDRDVYRIHFSPVSESVKAARNGMICINRADSAIVRIEYEFTPMGMSDVFKTSMKSTLGKVLGKSRHEGKRLSSFTNYLPYNNKWYLQDSQLLISTDFRDKTDTLSGTIRLHFVANDILKSNGNAVPPSDQLLDTALFAPQRIARYDEVYWSNFNHIIPSGPMRRIVDTLKK
ncbi:carboxypeptidase-like regulatory domain-containing protein [Telluribacter sp. SYSU D00476]|uniref:carboxypeptidase-like regulatory domain-containing protein n=1 Tax=Telluribacter sp. SYSU D00476 TaxID=2811430 RepID=UPI001FF44120|nr:carboxypeptidase-like regulatory domain-containing protein [Telluribacter sp. SYSU D00476]